MTETDLHPRISAAARGELPEWSRVETERLTHIESVARLMGDWAKILNLNEIDCQRWIAAAWLHDALRNADPEELDGVAGEYPASVRHGPAAAASLESEGVDDHELLDAIRYHSIGRAGLQRMGRYLFLADYLEPARQLESDDREALRARLPADVEEALIVVSASRMAYQLELGNPLLSETVEFWNELTGER